MWGALLIYLVGLVSIALIYPLILSIYVSMRDQMIAIIYRGSAPQQLVQIMPYLETAIYLFPYVSFIMLTIWLVITLYRYSVEGREYRW
ncbi:MAG: hypothetical protein QXH81_08160 [Thermofilaceae archaeon]